MKDQRKTITDRLYSLRKALYIPIAAATLFLTQYSISQIPTNQNKTIEINNNKSSKKDLERILENNQNKFETEILDKFKEKDYISVIVNLYDGEFFLNKMELSKTLIKEKQDYVLSTLSDSDFKLKHKYKTIYSFAGEINKKGLEKLVNHNDVEFIYSDKILQKNLTESVPLINADDVHNIQLNSVNIRGDGQVIAIIDSGIDYTHPDLGGGFGPDYKVIGGYDFANNDDDPIDELADSHGTNVAGIAAANGIIKGVAPNAKLLAVKICDEEVLCSAEIAGMDWCVDNKNNFGITVLTDSLGGGVFDNTNCPTWMNRVIDRIYSAGLPFTVASGNNGNNNGITYPACNEKTISVGAVFDANIGPSRTCVNRECSEECPITPSFVDKVTCYTNSDEILDLMAPGDVITTTRIGGAYNNASGTSMATPHVAGTIALMKQANPSLGIEDIRQILKNTGVPVTDPKNGLTFPRIDALSAVACSLEHEKISDRIICPKRFMRGDANRDNIIDISDPIKTLFYLYHEVKLDCLDAADSNDNGKIELGDSLFTLNYLFLNGSSFSAPNSQLGYDFTPDELRCSE